MPRTLSDSQNGEIVIVKQVIAEDGMRRRLQDLGFIEGIPVANLNTGALGDPTAYRIHGTVIALRHEDAKQIIIED